MSEPVTQKRTLRLNWVEARPTLSGGIKSNRLIAEAMQRRGHTVTTSFLPPSWGWPKPWRVRRMIKRIKRGVGDKYYPHHLQHGEITLNQMPTRKLNPDLIPDADVTFASWWDVWRQVHTWSSSKGLKVHYVRHYETHGGDEQEVDDAYRLCGPRVVISTWLKRILNDLGHEEVIRVPNGVDWDQFDSQPRRKAHRPTVGMLMGLSSFKDTPTGIRAIHRLVKQYPDLRVIGFGTRQLPKEMNVPDCVEFYESPDQSMIPQLYQQADCWVIPSSAEGFGMPGIESMASHCPLVSTRCGGPEDFIREGENGYLVDVGDDEAMADRISRILNLENDAWEEMSAKSYEMALDFSWDRSAEKLEEALYRWLDESDPEWSK
ncbi:MAG: glycosyltransferase family 4 protein [Phycisphaerales bacterium]|nr:glycosyltransferase family 4 protein [Phycisphaerales bacterium]